MHGPMNVKFTIFLIVGVGDICIYLRNLTGNLRTDIILLSYRL